MDIRVQVLDELAEGTAHQMFWEYQGCLAQGEEMELYTILSLLFKTEQVTIFFSGRLTQACQSRFEKEAMNRL